MICPQCEASIKDGSNFCDRCGMEFSISGMNYIPHKEVYDDKKSIIPDYSDKKKNSTVQRGNPYTQQTPVQPTMAQSASVRPNMIQQAYVQPTMPQSVRVQPAVPKPVKERKPVSKKFILIMSLVGVVLIALAIVATVFVRNKMNDDFEDLIGKTTRKNSYLTTEDTTTSSNTYTITHKVSNKYEFDIDETHDASNMKRGQGYCEENIYFGLSCVVETKKIDSAYGVDKTASDGKVFILAYFEVYNNSMDVYSLSSTRFHCYKDDTSDSSKADNFYGTVVVPNGIDNVVMPLDRDSSCIIVCKYEVDDDWDKLILTKDKLEWTISHEDTSDSFDGEKIFNIDYEYDYTDEGDVIYEDETNISFEGSEIYTKESYSGEDTDYLIIKLKLTNNSGKELDYQNVRYSQRAYRDNYSIGYTYNTYSGDIDGFKSIYDVDTIADGETVKFYIAFKTSEKNGDFRVTFTDKTGYNPDDMISIYCKE